MAAGGLVTIRAVIELAEPVYHSPVSFVDYSAVVLTTVAWLVAGWAVFLLSRRPPLRRVSLLLLAAAVGLVVEAIGNLLEDLLDVPFGGDLYVWGGIVGAIGLMVGSLVVLTVGHPLRWSGLFLLGVLAGGVFPDEGGQFLSGISLLGLGYWLIRYQPALQVEPLETST